MRRPNIRNEEREEIQIERPEEHSSRARQWETARVRAKRVDRIDEVR